MLPPVSDFDAFTWAIGLNRYTLLPVKRNVFYGTLWKMPT